MLEKKISDKIQQTRKNKGLTLAQLSEEVGLSKELLSRIENNQVSSPIATLSKVARGLGYPSVSFSKRMIVTKKDMQ
jgi:transcriptional regulator with XRE-family HTH domain